MNEGLNHPSDAIPSYATVYLYIITLQRTVNIKATSAGYF